MVTVKGVGVCGGAAFGKIYILKKKNDLTAKFTVGDAQGELKRFESARLEAMGQLDGLYQKALAGGEDGAMIFEIHKMMLCDEDFLNCVRHAITDEKINAEAAVDSAKRYFAELFLSMDDEYMRGRAADIRDVSQRLLTILSGGAENKIISDEPVILVADDLSPSETISLDRSKILAFVTENGSSNSHTAILARTMNIPAVVGTTGILNEADNAETAAVYGDEGVIYINPDKNIIADVRLKKEKHEREQLALEKLKNIETVTKDGTHVSVCANVGGIEDIEAALTCGADGVGLLRSEFIYLGRENYPTEEEQFEIYRTAAETLAGKRLVIRTLDIGADKTADYFGLIPEENPAMGIRAIRFCLARPDVFKTQLRAVYRASAYGNISVMLPMVATLSELLETKEIIDEVKNSLRADGINFDESAKLGIMIETPSAAVISDVLAPHVDFFSVGTNDLTQYTMAADRQNSGVAKLCNAKSLAVLRLIKIAAGNAKKYGKPCGVCGDIASSPEYTEILLALGVTELSVTPFDIPKVKKKIIETDVSYARKTALKLMN